MPAIWLPAQSICPLATGGTRLAFDVYEGKSTSGTCSLLLSQKYGFCFMLKPCGLNLSSMNGPVPTGLGSANVVGSPTDCQMCWGRMLTCPMRNRFAYWGVLKFSVTDLPDEVALVGSGVPTILSAGFLMNRLNVYATSAALNGLPSFHFTPWRMVRLSVLPLFDQVYPVASMGTGASVEFSVLKMKSGSLYRPAACVV